MPWMQRQPGALSRSALIRRRADWENGFTLIELLVTLAILGFVTVSVVGYKPLWSTTIGLRGAVAEIAGGLRETRSEAILRNRPVSFNLDLAKRRFRIGSGPVRQLPAELTVTLLTIAEQRQTAQTGSILFNPDGSSTGGRVGLSLGPNTVAIGVDWLTGAVSVADAH